MSTHPIIAQLAERRRALGLTLDAIAARSGVSKTALSETANGHHVPRLDTVDAIATAIGMRLALTPIDEPTPRTPDPAWEYQTGTCDVWEIQHLCNYMAEYGWEPIAMNPIPNDIVRLPERIGDDNGPMRKGRPSQAHIVLFRRPFSYTADHEETDR